MNQTNKFRSREAVALPNTSPAGAAGALRGLALAGLIGLAASGCSGGSGGGSGELSGLLPGAITTNPATGSSFVVAGSRGGKASSVKVTGMYWGRLVDILDVDRTVVFRDFVIGEDVKSNGSEFLLERNAVTEKETLTILHQFGTPAFENAFATVDDNVQYVLDKGLASTVVPPYTMVARNSTLVVVFDDLIEENTVGSDTILARTGYPPITPYEARILPDPTHGDLLGGVFRSTRVIVDLTVSRLEAEVSSLEVNSLGLPSAITTLQPNFVVRIPTQQGPGQFNLLTNVSGSRVSFAGSGSNDPFSPTLDVLRAMRSGGATSITNDPNNGFMFDEISPEILGAQGVNVFINTPALPGENTLIVDVVFQTLACAGAPRFGDVIELPNHKLLITSPAPTPVNGRVDNVDVEVLIGDPQTLFDVAGVYRTTWDPATGVPPECFVRFSPPAATLPNLDVSVGADVLVSFSEPIDPSTVTAFETFTLEYDNNPNGINPLYKRVVGRIEPAQSLLDFTFAPEVPLRHQNTPETYTFSIDGPNNGVTDLAGNRLRFPFDVSPFAIDPAQPMVDSGSVALTFVSQDEDNNLFPEVRGQLLFDLSLGIIKPRAVDRFSAAADPTQPVVGTMIPIAVPIVTPLSPYGSKMMTVWRYHDVGFTLLDDNTHNLDVEGLWWEPFGGILLTDSFPDFEMLLSHSAFIPDEDLTTGLLPSTPGSGLAKNYDGNYLDSVTGGDPPVVVHSKEQGYQLLQSDITSSVNGRNIAPWPMNRNAAPGEFVYWTWRDTAKLGQWGPNGFGVDTRRYQAVTGLGLSKFWDAKFVPTVGLPMLLEFNTFPSAAQGRNGFQIAIAINSSANPYFRTFSTGGVLSTGATILIDPAQETSGKGGVNPISQSTTQPRDNSFYYGQADFVVRVSRVHTIWLDTQGFSNFAAPTIEPAASEQPTGTQLVMAYRGATAINGAEIDYTNARNLSPYGESYSNPQHNKLSSSGSAFTPTFHPFLNDPSWTTDVTTLSGAKFVQARITMISNTETSLTPVVSALGFSYSR